MPEPTLAAGFARALMDLAVSKGADRKVLAARSAIDPADLQDQKNRIPFAKYVALMRAGKELCNDPALALHFGEAFDPAELSVVGLLGGASETMAEGFAQVNRADHPLRTECVARSKTVLRESGKTHMQ